MTATLFDLPSSPTLQVVADLLDRVFHNEKNAADRALIVEGIVTVAAEHDGYVDTNILRAWLRAPEREAWLATPQVVGSVFNRLSAAGVIVFDHWTDSTDRRGGNAGRPARVWRLVGGPR